jgi:hypothetical protein
MFASSDLKALRAFVGGYLHQDFVAEHKTPAGALEAYCREVDRAEIVELEGDLDCFMFKTSTMPFDAAREIFVRELHSGWSPPDRVALADLVRILRARLLK